MGVCLFCCSLENGVGVERMVAREKEPRRLCLGIFHPPF